MAKKRLKSDKSQAVLTTKERLGIGINIMIVVTDYIKEHSKIPTFSEIAQLTGYHIDTVSQHLTKYYAEKKSEESAKLTDLIANQILAVMAKQALNGSVVAARVFFEAYFKMFQGNATEERELPKLTIEIYDPTEPQLPAGNV